MRERQVRKKIDERKRRNEGENERRRTGKTRRRIILHGSDEDREEGSKVVTEKKIKRRE